MQVKVQVLFVKCTSKIENHLKHVIKYISFANSGQVKLIINILRMLIFVTIIFLHVLSVNDAQLLK